MNIAARTIALNRKGERLTFDYASREGGYRLAYYYPKSVKEEGRWRTVEGRTAAKHKSLVQALTIVFAETPGCKQDPDTVEHYMRSTSWGRELP